jgi:hypothetical protein
LRELKAQFPHGASRNGMFRLRHRVHRNSEGTKDRVPHYKTGGIRRIEALLPDINSFA